MAKCGLCNGRLLVLGRLGRLLHLKCRQCGAQFSREIAPAKLKKLGVA